MASETIQCPDCQRRLRVPPELLGKNVKCPSCGKTFVAELSGTAPAAEVLEEGFQEEPRPSRRRRDDYDEEETSDEYQEERRPRRRRDYLPHRGVMILVLGILSLVMCGIVTGIPAWVMGNSDLQAMREGRMDPEGEGLTKAGKICGMISVGLMLVACLGWGFLFLLSALGRGLR